MQNILLGYIMNEWIEEYKKFIEALISDTKAEKVLQYTVEFF